MNATTIAAANSTSERLAKLESDLRELKATVTSQAEKISEADKKMAELERSVRTASRRSSWA